MITGCADAGKRDNIQGAGIHRVTHYYRYGWVPGYRDRTLCRIAVAAAVGIYTVIALIDKTVSEKLAGCVENSLIALEQRPLHRQMTVCCTTEDVAPANLGRTRHCPEAVKDHNSQIIARAHAFKKGTRIVNLYCICPDLVKPDMTLAGKRRRIYHRSWRLHTPRVPCRAKQRYTEELFRAHAHSVRTVNYNPIGYYRHTYGFAAFALAVTTAAVQCQNSISTVRVPPMNHYLWTSLSSQNGPVLDSPYIL